MLCSWDTFLSQCLSKGTGELSGKADEILGVICGGLVPHPGRNTPSLFMLQKQNVSRFTSPLLRSCLGGSLTGLGQRNRVKTMECLADIHRPGNRSL